MLAVGGVLIGIVLLLIAFLVFIARSRLKKPLSQIALSITTGLMFGLGSLALILLSEKFNDWSFLAKLTYASQISVFVFITDVTH